MQFKQSIPKCPGLDEAGKSTAKDLIVYATALNRTCTCRGGRGIQESNVKVCKEECKAKREEAV